MSKKKSSKKVIDKFDKKDLEDCLSILERSKENNKKIKGIFEKIITNKNISVVNELDEVLQKSKELGNEFKIFHRKRKLKKLLGSSDE